MIIDLDNSILYINICIFLLLFKFPSEGKVDPFIHFVRLLSCTSHCIREMSCHTTLNSLEGYIVLVAVKYLFKVLICVVVVFVHMSSLSSLYRRNSCSRMRIAISKLFTCELNLDCLSE